MSFLQTTELSNTVNKMYFLHVWNKCCEENAASYILLLWKNVCIGDNCKEDDYKSINETEISSNRERSNVQFIVRITI